MHPSIPLRFVFDDPEPVAFSRAWIEDLAQSANRRAESRSSPEHFNTDPEVIDPDDSTLAVGKVEVEELAIDKLKVAGTEMPGGAIPHRRCGHPGRFPRSRCNRKSDPPRTPPLGTFFGGAAARPWRFQTDRGPEPLSVA